MKITTIIISAAMTLTAMPTIAQDTYKALKFKTATSLFNYEMLDVHRQGYERKESLRKATASKEAMESYIRTARERFKAIAGTTPARGETEGRTVGTVHGEGFKIEKIVFKSAPGRYVTAHLYLPENAKGRIPACIEMCGHGLDGKGSGSGSAEQIAVNGIAVMVVDPLSQGERQQTIDRDGKNMTRGVTTEHTLLAPAYLLLGSSLATQEYYDNSRAIDYLMTRKDIDPERIGCYGFSGGGTQAAYLAGLDSRVKATCVGLFFSSRERTLETQGPSDGCQWMAYEGRERIEIADMAMMNAPRPFLILDGRFDFVDHWGALQGYDELRACYTALGEPGNVEQFYYDDGHAIPEESQERMVRFFRKALTGDTTGEVKPYRYWRGERQEMLCTKAGQVNMEYRDALSTMAECEAGMDRLEPMRARFCQQDEATVQRKIRELLGINGKEKAWKATQTGHATLRDAEEYRFQIDCEGEYPVPVIVRVPTVSSPGSKIRIHLSDKGKGAVLMEKDRRDAVSDGTIELYADLRGYGETADIFEYNLSKYWNTQYRTAVTALHTGRPMMGQRVTDLMTVLDFCSSDERLKGRTVEIEADGDNAVIVMHTAVLDKRIAATRLTKTLKTWRTYIQNPMQHDMMQNVIPSVLMYYDIPDLIRMAKGRLRIVD